MEQTIKISGDYILVKESMRYDIYLNNRVIQSLYFVDEKTATKEFNKAVKSKTTNCL